jgi:3-deoxy-D-arabino-heptulosonate 7-phosphate (DAHP) synthase
MRDIVLSHGDIVLTHGDIYSHGNSKKKIGNGIKPFNDIIRKMTSQVNNPSTGIAGLGTQSDILSRSNFKPSNTNIMYGSGILNSQLSKINFNTNKRDRNVRLRL